MKRLKEKEKKFLEKCNSILRNLFIIVGFVFIFIYLIKGGFNLLVINLIDSKMLITYSIALIILLSILIFLNINDDEKTKSRNLLSGKKLNTIVTVLLVIFSLFFAFSLIDFILPIIILVLILVFSNFFINKLIGILVFKYGIK